MTRFTAKGWLGGTGLVVGLAGIALEQRAGVWLAVALLSAAFVLRIGERRTPR